ncbi:MAG TPA: PP2C family protein-serine/threonine phosphatase [Pyrinomonadaceae bacterium]|jgi:sigma-B regulation protein RsbU (phosphoserine phosphatase)
MTLPGFNGVLAPRLVLDSRLDNSQRRSTSKADLKDLEVRLAALQKDYAELHTAVFEAAQVHRRLCAPRLVRYGEFEIASEIFAVRHLAGDFFTMKETNHGVVMTLGDICGKGLAAGMWTTHLVGLVGARAAVHSEPETIVAGVNRDVCLLASMVPLASLFVARLDPGSGKLEYCSAGHPPALLLRANGDVELLSDGGLLLGVVAAAPYVRGTVELGPGDVLLAYSDGVLESLNKSEEEFGPARLEDQLRRATLTSQSMKSGSTASISAENVLFSVLAAVQDFAATHPIVDDMSLVIIRRDAY